MTELRKKHPVKHPRQISSASMDARVSQVEKLLGETLAGFTVAGRAINRLESYLFSFLKVAMSNGTISYDQLVQLGQELSKQTNLLDFWGVVPIDVPASPNPQAVSEVSTENS